MAGRRLIALNAKTGVPIAGFGKGGEVDIVVPYNSVPLVYKNVIVVGANTPPGAVGGIGNPRAFDARTGAKLWEFSSVPQPGDVGHDTWEGDSWKGRLGVNAWPFYFTLDEQRGLLYMPLASPIPDAYGGDRKGANLFGNSVVALDIQTGKYKWHFQTIHHDLVGSRSAGASGTVRHRAQRPHRSRTGLDDEVGLHVHPQPRNRSSRSSASKRRPVAKSDVPGEHAFPTQPFPVKPPPIARVGYKPEDLVTAAGHDARARRRVQRSRRDQRHLQRRTIHAVGVSRRRRASRNRAEFSWRPRRRELGRNGVQSTNETACMSSRKTTARLAGWNRAATDRR